MKWFSDKPIWVEQWPLSKEKIEALHTLVEEQLKSGHIGREVGGGIGMGKTCEPKAFSFQCMTKFTTKKKKNQDIW